MLFVAEIATFKHCVWLKVVVRYEFAPFMSAFVLLTLYADTKERLPESKNIASANDLINEDTLFRDRVASKRVASMRSKTREANAIKVTDMSMTTNGQNTRSSNSIGFESSSRPHLTKLDCYQAQSEKSKYVAQSIATKIESPGLRMPSLPRTRSNNLQRLKSWKEANEKRKSERKSIQIFSVDGNDMSFDTTTPHQSYIL